MKLSELLYKYATETAQTKITSKTAQQFLKQLKIENKTIQPKNDSK